MIENKTELDSFLESIPTIEKGQGVDVEEFAGLRKKIEKIEVIETISHFTAEGKFDEKVQNKVKSLKISTEAVTKITTKDKKEVAIRGSELFNMVRDDNGNWGISTSPKAKIQKFFKRQKVSTLKALIGTSVQLKDYEDKKTGNKYLGFVIE
jgi:hypothetical protein